MNSDNLGEDVLSPFWTSLVFDMSGSTTYLETTPPKFNIAPEKWWLEDEFPFGIAYFLGRTVKFPGCIGLSCPYG